MKKTFARHLLIIAFIFIVLTIFRILWLAYFTPSQEQPTAQAGILDMRNQSLSEDIIFQMNGEWIYYPEVLVDTTNSNLLEQMIRTIPMKDASATTQQVGTYRLKILLNTNDNRSDHRYAIQVPAIATASALYINGKLVGQSGVVSTNASEHQGQAAPYTVYFTEEQPVIDVILHVSNFDTPSNAVITKRLSFSSAPAMMHHQLITQLSLVFIAMLLILFALFSILVFLFIYRKKIVLLFTVGFLLPLADELITYDRSILNWLHLDYAWSVKLSNIVYLGASFFFVQFMRTLLEKYQQVKYFKWFSMLYGIATLLILLLPIGWLYTVNLLFYLLYIVSFLSVVALALKEYIGNQESSAFIAFTAIGTTNGIIWGLIKMYFVIDIPFYPFDYLMIALGFSGYWFQRFYENKQQIDLLVAQLQKDVDMKDEFLLSNAQKLWDPMNKMITLGQTIYDNKNNHFDTEDKQNLKYLIDIGRSMSFTLNDILDYTRLKDGNLHLHKKTVSIQAVVSGVFDMLRFIATGKQIQMTSTIARSFPYVLADEKRLIQILFNLLHSSIKYTNAGQIEISATIEKNMALIHIRDISSGMDKNDMKCLDQQFSFAQGLEDNDGVHLSLLISKQLIDLHGGALQINASPNNVLDLFFTLPIAEDMKVEEQDNTPQENVFLSTSAVNFESVPSEKKFKILMVDDDPANLTMMRSLFTTTEYDITALTSSEKVMELLPSQRWDLIIMDAMLPYISGYALIENIRAHYSLLELPILLLTARSNPEDVYTGFALGANDYVTKPINSLELKVRCRALIDLKYSIHQRLHLETAWLQAQIQPHFLYNTLNTIASLSTIDPNRMIDLMHHFGKYLHASFDVKNLQRVIPLHDELELVRSYLYIEQQRFGDLLQIVWDIDENINIEIPPITIQTLVENALRHGVLKQKEGGTVCIRVKELSQYVAISVIDDGIGIDASTLDGLLSETNTSSPGIGLRNTDLRLKRIYGQRLQITSTPNKGTTITFHIPKK
ncbi:ATP-binding protein [Lysinibacillus sp. NPDC097195]|uniref:ATP-binding protein n=1 Tax=Lysinibacillus sp. NPDC097195 TaxID=3364141 RepID=UPI003807EF91